MVFSRTVRRLAAKLFRSIQLHDRSSRQPDYLQIESSIPTLTLIGLVAWASKYERITMPPSLKKRMHEEPDKLIADVARWWAESNS